MKHFTLSILALLALANVANAQLQANQSVIVVKPGYVYQQNIEYINYIQTGLFTMDLANSVEVGAFILEDGNSTGDPDLYPTIMDSLAISITNSNYIHSIGLFVNNTLVRQVYVAAQDTVGFGSLNVIALDNDQTEFTLRVAYTPEVVDKGRNIYTVTFADAANLLSSQFASSNAGGASTSISGADNIINVTATKLVWTTQPSTSTVLNTPMPITPIVSATDENNVVDEDYAGTLTITDLSGLGLTGNTEATTQGQWVFDNLKIVSKGVTRLFTNAAASGISLPDDTSNEVEVVGPKARRWDGAAGDGQWTTAANWYPDGVPDETDSVVIDNLVYVGDYTISLNSSTTQKVKWLTIHPLDGYKIKVEMGTSSTAGTVLQVVGEAGKKSVKIYTGGTLHNQAPGNGSPSHTFEIQNGEFWIYNSGVYSHQTLMEHADLVDRLAVNDSTYLGQFEFDVPGAASYNVDLDNNVLGTVAFRASKPGAAGNYLTANSGTTDIRGDLIVFTNAEFEPTVNTVKIGRNMLVGGEFDPSATTKVVLHGHDVQKVSGNGLYRINILEVDKPSNYVQLLTPIYMEDGAGTELRMTKGNIVTDINNLLVLDVNAITSGGSPESFVDGPMRKSFNSTTSVLLPIGDDTLYRGITIMPTTTSLTSYTAEYFAVNPTPPYDTSKKDMTLARVSGVEWWRVTRTGTAPARLKIRYATRSGVAQGGEPDLRVAYWDGSQWTNKGGNPLTGNFSQGTITSDPLNTFGVFTLASTSLLNPLPVELIRFEGFVMGEDIRLEWTTASELNNSGFEIERSTDGKGWLNIGWRDGVGTYQGITEYDFMDMDANAIGAPVLYYRLKQIDHNGEYHYSDVIAVRMSNVAYTVEKTWYDNVGNQVRMDMSAKQNGQLNMVLYDMNGRNVYTHNMQVSQGQNRIAVALPQVPAGVYVMQVAGTDFNQSTKLYISQR